MKRFLTFFLSVCMIMGVVPISLAYAATDLSTDSVLDSYAIRAEAVFPDSGSFTIKGSCSDSGKDFYSFTVDTKTGLTLTKTENGLQTSIESISIDDAYINGVSVVPNSKYTAILQNHKGLIECFINETPVISYIDKAPLSAGTSAVDASEGTILSKPVVGAADFVTALTILDRNGNAVESVDVPVGNVPEIKALTLKADYADGTSENIPLDRVEISEIDTLTVGEKTATVAFKQAKLDLVYNIVNRTELVQNIIQRIEKLDISAITINDKTEIQEISDLYDTLSGIEKEAISTNVRKKLEDALDKLEVVICPELKGAKIVFKDTFDNSDSDKNYESHVSVTGDRRSGYWYTENGRMLQYSIFDEYRSGSFAAKTVLKDRNFEIRSVSADVMVIDPNVFLGIDACFGDGKFFEFYITDKTNVDGGNRIQLFKNGTMIANTVETDSSKWFVPYTWYNLRITLDNGKIRCYVDDVLRLEADDIPASPTDTLLTTGTVALRNTEGWGMFDNLVVRGTELPVKKDEVPAPKLTPGYYSDHFEDETTGTSPSHWIENNKEDRWTVGEEKSNKYYQITNSTTVKSQTWLHVFEQDVDYSAKVRVKKLGSVPSMGLYARVNADDSFIKGGYDFTHKKWFINVRLGIDFEEEITYAETESEVKENQWYNISLKTVGEDIELYVGGKLVVSAKAGKKVMPGRTGFFTERCDIDVDNIELRLLSGQGRVEDGVLEYTPDNAVGRNLSMIALPDGRLWFFAEGVTYLSDDEGQTATEVQGFTDARPTTMVRLPDGSYLHIKNCLDAYRSTDGCVTWEKVGELPRDPNSKYAQPGDRINMIKLDNGVYRVFHTIGRQSNVGDKSVISETYYSDDNGYTWTQSKNSPMEYTNLDYFCETQIIKIKDGPLIQYCSYNEGGCMRYSLSHDDGVTWTDEYALPQIPCSLGSFSVKEDPFEPGTFYISTLYNPPYDIGNSRPRHRIALLRSYDGLNWEYLADIDRWGDISDGGRAEIMQNVNMKLNFSENYVFPSFSRSEEYENSSSGHNVQLARIYRFEKSKLKAYDKWPQEYVIDPKAITHIEAMPTVTEYKLGDEFKADDVKVKIEYFDGSSEIIPLSDTNYTIPDTKTPGEKKVTVDYQLFRDVYTIQVGEKGDWVNPFKDVQADDWFEGSVGFAYTNQLTGGTSVNEFSPEESITRGMLVTLLHRAENQPRVIVDPGFKDLEADMYYVEAVKWAARHGIVTGYTETSFAPNDKITREQIAAIIYRYAKYKGYDVSVGEETNILSYEDFDRISEYAIPAIQYTCGSGVMKGKTDSTINPSDFATRAEVVTVLQRLLENN